MDREIADGDGSGMHYAMDTPEELMLVCAGSATGRLSMVMPGFSMEKKAGRSRTILIEE